MNNDEKTLDLFEKCMLIKQGIISKQGLDLEESLKLLETTYTYGVSYFKLLEKHEKTLKSINFRSNN